VATKRAHKDRNVKGIIALTLLLAAFLAFHPAPARAADGHENSCSVVNVGFQTGMLTLVCASGSVNMAILNGNSSAGTCPTVDMDTLKIMTSQALAARVSGLVVTIWYTDACGANGGSATIRAINSIEVKGN
jgi:glycerol uptake facilitator-like aquaporin